jgi:hypothetical protein
LGVFYVKPVGSRVNGLYHALAPKIAPETQGAPLATGA